MARGGRSRPTSGRPPRELASRSLKRNLGSALIGNVAYTLSQFAMLAVAARLTTTTDVGRYGLALAIAAPVFVFAGMKLRQVQATDTAGAHTTAEYTRLRVLTSSTAFILVCCVGVVVGLPGVTLSTLVAVAAHKALEGQLDLHYGFLQRHEQLQLVARAQVVRGVLGLTAFVIGLAGTGRIDVAAAAVAVVTAVQVIVNRATVRRWGLSDGGVGSRRGLVRLARLALPLAVSVAVGSLTMNVPRYVVQGHLGEAAVGVFTALGYVLVAASTVAIALGEAASPRLANLFHRGERRAFAVMLARLVTVGVGLGLAGLAGAWLLGRPLLTFVFGAPYGAQAEVLVVLAGATAVSFSTVFIGTALNAMRKFSVQAPVSLLMLAVVGACSLWAVPAFGLIGAALAALAGQLVQSACYVWLLIRYVAPALREST